MGLMDTTQETQQEADKPAGAITRVEVATPIDRSYENYLRDAVFTETREVIVESGYEKVDIHITGYIHPTDKKASTQL